MSPRYEAVIVTLPAVDPITVTEHAPLAERVQVLPDENEMVPVPAVFENVIVSPVTVPPYPVRVAVQVEPLHPTVTVGEALMMLMVKPDEGPLEEWSVSPAR